MSGYPVTSTSDATEQRPWTGASWMSSNRPASMYAAVLMAMAGGIVWVMAGAPDGTAKNWLILAWILLTSTYTAFALALKPLPRVVNLALAGLVVGVVVWAWLAGVQQGSLTTPFIPLAIGTVGMAFARGRHRPEPEEAEGLAEHHD